MEKYEVVKFTDNELEIDVNVSPQENTVWLSKEQMSELFQRDRSVISRHVKKLFNEELEEKSNVHFLHIAISDKPVPFYSLDVAISVGHRIKSKRTAIFHSWCKEVIANLQERDVESNIIRFSQGKLSLDVKISPEEETVYLSQNQIALLFETSQQNISNHITNIVEEEELSYEATHKDFLLVQLEGDREVKRSVTFYNLDMILSIGYRVKSKIAIAFRKWATYILKHYLLKGYVLDNNRIVVSKNNFVQLENDVAFLKEEVANIKEKIYVEPIKQKIFFDGTYFDAYEFITSLVNKAKNKITIIDPYFDIKGLNVLKNTSQEVIRVICLSKKAKLLDYDIEQFKMQYGEIQILFCDTFHDRFLIIDDNECYILGTSLNYMGDKTFGVNKVEDQIVIKGILKRIED